MMIFKIEERESEIERICMVRREMQKYYVKRDAKRSTDADAERRGLKRPALPAAKEKIGIAS